jgi:hypothetical protein
MVVGTFVAVSGPRCPSPATPVKKKSAVAPAQWIRKDVSLGMVVIVLLYTVVIPIAEGT